MEKTKLKQVTQLLVNNGYTVKGTTIKAPNADNPLDAISIQNQITGLAEMFKDHEFTQAWEPEILNDDFEHID